MSTATPSGKSVKFVMSPQTCLEGVNFGLFFVPAGIMMRTVISAMKLNVEPHELNCATRFVDMLLIPACRIIMSVVRRKVCHAVGV